MKTIVYRFAGYSGFPDVLLSLLPKLRQVKAIARRILRGPYKGWNFENPFASLQVQMPWGTYRVLDERGNVEPCSSAAGPIP